LSKFFDVQVLTAEVVQPPRHGEASPVAGDVLHVEGEPRAKVVQPRPAFRPQAHVQPEVEGVQLLVDVQKQAGLARRVAAAPPLPDEACRRETPRSRSRLLSL
jgi:hypothetical protein